MRMLQAAAAAALSRAIAIEQRRFKFVDHELL